MRKLFSFIVGLGLGITAGMLLVTLFSPVSGPELRQNLRDHYQEALAAGRKAAAERRTELENELQSLYEKRSGDNGTE